MADRVVQSYKVLVGLEIHVQLATKTKMFTSVANASGAAKPGDTPAEPNSAVDPVILGLPGSLPVINKKAVEYSIKAGLALGCKIAKHTKWDRKSYYYPDLPKNYQISQYDLPLCYEGEYTMQTEDGPQTIRIRRAHLEEDAGKLLHDAPGGYAIDYSIVDLNRAGTPLLEIVTEPDFHTPKQVAQFAAELQKIVQFLGVSEGQMQMGHMRFEPNINVHITAGDGKVYKTAITEIKNLNSFSVLERATAYEIQRQINEWIDTGSLGKKSTYGWDEPTESTFHQRDKEDANDYRYFPDPDLVPVEVSESWLMELKSQNGELPMARKERYVKALGLNPADATTLAGDRETGNFYEVALKGAKDPKRVSNLIINVLATLANKSAKPVHQLGITPQAVTEVANLIDQNQISASSALPLFEKALTDGAPASAGMESLAKDLGLIQSNDTAPIDAAIDALIASNPKTLQDYKSGKQAAFGGLVGAIMKSGKGLNPKIVAERLKEKIG